MRTGAINLGQGFPDTDGPAAVIEAAVAALRGGENQYAPLPGVPALREAVLEHQRHWYGLEPEDVLVTFGATEAIAARCSGCAIPATRSSCSSPTTTPTRRASRLPARSGGPSRCARRSSRCDPDALRARDRPAGARAAAQHARTTRPAACSSRDELELIAAACIEHDLVCVTDEVYEHLVYDGEHIPLATLPGMARAHAHDLERRASRSRSPAGRSAGARARAELVAATRTVKQFLTFAGGTPLQHAAAAALRLPARRASTRCATTCAPSATSCARAWPRRACGRWSRRARTSSTPTSATDAVEFCATLPERCGVVAIPTSVFYDDQDAAPTLVRFAFCKRPEVIAEAARRLASLG